jgi:hypothetical protein
MRATKTNWNKYEKKNQPHVKFEPCKVGKRPSLVTEIERVHGSTGGTHPIFHDCLVQ